MALKIIDHGSKEYQQMIKLRDDILRKPLGLSFSPEELEKEKGQIAVGMLADLAVLSADVFTVPVEQMEAIRSVMTIFGGKIVHDTGIVH